MGDHDQDQVAPRRSGDGGGSDHHGGDCDDSEDHHGGGNNRGGDNRGDSNNNNSLGSGNTRGSNAMSSPVKAFIAASAKDPFFRKPGGSYCAVVGCHNNSKRDGARGIKFHVFPKNEERKSKWIAAVRRSNPGKPTALWNPGSSSVVCSAHFVGGKKSNDPGNPAYCPTIFPTHTTKATTPAGNKPIFSFFSSPN